MVGRSKKTFSVSIHAPREGCDHRCIAVKCFQVGFNSRTPGGVRLPLPIFLLPIIRFNSRTPGGVRRGLHEGGTLCI